LGVSGGGGDFDFSSVFLQHQQQRLANAHHEKVEGSL
jgi:hypothetical protein